MAPLIRRLILAVMTLAVAAGSTADTGWLIGAFSVWGADEQGWKGSGVSASHREPGRQSNDPLTDTLVFKITSSSGSWSASITGIPRDQSVSIEEVFPWLRDVPQTVRFRVKGKHVYFLDSKNKQHKGDIGAN